jgi:hypothetical protein
MIPSPQMPAELPCLPVMTCHADVYRMPACATVHRPALLDCRERASRKALRSYSLPTENRIDAGMKIQSGENETTMPTTFSCHAYMSFRETRKIVPEHWTIDTPDALNLQKFTVVHDRNRVVQSSAPENKTQKRVQAGTELCILQAGLPTSCTE